MDSAIKKDDLLLRKIEELFHIFNHRYFNGAVPVPRFRLSRRLRKAGRCVVVTDRATGTAVYEAEIVFSVPYHDKYGWDGELEDTLKHEMAHLYLFVIGRPWGHTREFEEICCRIGATLYSKDNLKSYNCLFKCPNCGGEFKSKRRIDARCGRCNGYRQGGGYLMKIEKVVEKHGWDDASATDGGLHKRDIK